jgi:hypothetical protein
MDMEWEGRRDLLVKQIHGEGLMAAWNTEHPRAKVRIDDRIVQVNGHNGDVIRLMDEMQKHQVLNLTVRR